MFDVTRQRLRSNPGSGWLLGAQIPADLADWLDYVATANLMAFVWLSPPVAFAWLAIGLGLPYLTVGLVAGALVDRLDLRRVLVFSNLGRALATAALLLAPDWPQLVMILFLRGCADAFFTPAKQAALQALVRADDQMAVNGLSQAINQSSKIVAPALGGLLLLVIPVQGIFILNAAVSLVAAGLLAQLQQTPRPAKAPAPLHVMRDIAEGVGLLRGRPVLRSAVGLLAAGYFAMFFYDTLIAPLIHELGQPASAFGLVLAAVGVGGVTGALTLTRSTAVHRAFSLIAAGSAMSGLAIGGLGMAEIIGTQPPLWLIMALFALIGFASSLSVVPTRTILQQQTTPATIGRITSLSEASNTLALLIGPFVGAMLATTTSVGAAFVLGSVMMLGVAGAAGLQGRRFPTQ